MSNPCVACSQSGCGWCFKLCGAGGLVSLPWDWCPFLWDWCPFPGIGVPLENRHSQASGCWFSVQALPWCFSQLEVERDLQHTVLLLPSPCPWRGCQEQGLRGNLGSSSWCFAILQSQLRAHAGLTLDSCAAGQGISGTARVPQGLCPLSAGLGSSGHSVTTRVVGSWEGTSRECCGA